MAYAPYIYASAGYNPSSFYNSYIQPTTLDLAHGGSNTNASQYYFNNASSYSLPYTNSDPRYSKFQNAVGALSANSDFLAGQQATNPSGFAQYVKNPFTLPSNLKNYSLPIAQAAATNSGVAAPVSSGTAKSLGGTKTSGKGTPFAADPNVYLRELQQTYSQLGDLFNPTAIKKSYQDRIDLDTALGLQTANSAGREAAMRGLQSGNMQNANLIRAQALLPVYQHAGELNTSLQNQVLDINKARAGTAAQVAASLGQLRNQYANSLADYTSQISNIQSNEALQGQHLAEQRYEFNAGHQLDVSKLLFAQRQAQANQIENSPYSNDYDPNSTANLAGTHQNDWRYNSGARSQLLQQLLGANII